MSAECNVDRDMQHLLASFFDAILRISQQEYVPTDADILRARVKTTGIT